MNVGLIAKITEMIREVSNLGKTVVESTDPEKQANSIVKLNEGVSDTYKQMRELILKSNKLTEEEKLARLEDLAKQEVEMQKKTNEMLNENREQVARIVMEIVKGLLTCGVSYVPEIAKRLQLNMKSDVFCVESEIDS